MGINFAEIRTIPIEDVLAQYGIEFKRQGKMLVVKECPLPSHSSKNHYTFKADIGQNLWTCHSSSCRKEAGRNGGDVIDLVCLLDGVGAKEAALRLEGYKKAPASNGTKPVDSGAVVIPTHNKPLGFNLQTNPEHPLIQDRGISIETARLYGVGYYHSKQGTASMDDRIIFPLHENGVLIGYVGRTTLEVTPENPKWKMGKGLVKNILFGLERCDTAKPVIVTESPWAVLYFREKGVQAASLIGVEMTEGQEKALEPYQVLCIALDDDEAGRAASEKIAGRLKKNHCVTRAFLRE